MHVVLFHSSAISRHIFLQMQSFELLRLDLFVCPSFTRSPAGLRCDQEEMQANSSISLTNSTTKMSAADTHATCHHHKRRRRRVSHQTPPKAAHTAISLFLLLSALCGTAPNHDPRHRRGSLLFVKADDDILAELLREEAEQDDGHHPAGGSADAGEDYGESKYDRPPPDFNAGGSSKMGGMGGNKRTNMPGGGGGSGSASGGGPVPDLEEQLRQKQEEAAKAAATRAEEEAARIAEEHRVRREAEFEAEVKRMDAEQRKRALKQKKADAKVVSRILRAANAKPEPDHYAVLGLRNFELHVGPWHLFHISTRDVKKAYRNLSRRVHPDKNRDGRAEQAFHALEASAAVLSDGEQRRGYDRRVEARRKKRNQRITGTTIDVLDSTRRNVVRVFGTARRVLGPFSVPVFVLGGLALP